ncbi:unnamed protein product [Prorocentrum cordatum]|uniref:Uncharacterized protein n=1 Tax=Prorocentrum cordatum TaxID=2364126 RepID=A0ABN9YGF9_9DINO|nr:unnamed protein product [Polarella glacialis]
MTAPRGVRLALACAALLARASTARPGAALPPAEEHARAPDPYGMFDNSPILLLKACGRGEQELLMGEIEDHPCTLIDQVGKEGACSVTAVICPKPLHFEHAAAEVFRDDAGAYLRGAGLPRAWDRRSQRSDDFYAQWRSYDDILTSRGSVRPGFAGTRVRHRFLTTATRILTRRSFVGCLQREASSKCRLGLVIFLTTSSGISESPVPGSYVSPNQAPGRGGCRARRGRAGEPRAGHPRGARDQSRAHP